MRRPRPAPLQMPPESDESPTPPHPQAPPHYQHNHRQHIPIGNGQQNAPQNPPPQNAPQNPHQNGTAGHLHSISLPSPGKPPIFVHSFDGHGHVGMAREAATVQNRPYQQHRRQQSFGGSGGQEPSHLYSTTSSTTASRRSEPESGSRMRSPPAVTNNTTKGAQRKSPSTFHRIGNFLCSRCCLIALMIFLLLLALLLLAYSLLERDHLEELEHEEAAFLNKESSWRDSCGRKCTTKFDVPPLLVISLDGFRADYLGRKITPTVQRIMECGSTVPYMLPSYPTKTFPNHFTIVTGLYPEVHGIVDNHFYDEQMAGDKRFSKSSRNPAWYNGEPIWNTVEKNGKKSAIFYWPAGEVPIQGIMPSYTCSYNMSEPFSKRVDQVIEWLSLDQTQRPAFLAMYFEEPDATMHTRGPDSDGVNTALINVDAMVNYLMQRLDNIGLLGCINMVILSDHGAQKLHPSQFIAVDSFLEVKSPQVLNVVGGPIGHINFKDSATDFINTTLERMSCTGGRQFRTYTRESTPIRYHFTRSRRIGEIVMDGVGGTRFFLDQQDLAAHGPEQKGDHGYDNRIPEMHAIFGAWGPSVRSGHIGKPFQNTELYNLFATLLELPMPASNNGTLGRLHSLLRTPPPIEETESVEVAECEGIEFISSLGCQQENNDNNSSELLCTSEKEENCGKIAMRVPKHLLEGQQLCFVRFPGVTLLYNSKNGNGRRRTFFVESHLDIEQRWIDERRDEYCHIRLEVATKKNSIHKKPDRRRSLESDAERLAAALLKKAKEQNATAPWNTDPFFSVAQNSSANITEEGEKSRQNKISRNEGAKRRTWISSLFAGGNEQLQYIVQGQINVPIGFCNGVWKEMRTLIHQYLQHYKRLLLWTGPIFDRDHNGVADEEREEAPKEANAKEEEEEEKEEEEEADGKRNPNPVSPDYIFLILLRCPNNSWHQNGRHCEQPAETRTLAFVLPVVEQDLNCLIPAEYLLRHTTSIRDIELLTGNEWFLDREVYPPELAILLRTQLNEQLWPLEMEAI